MNGENALILDVGVGGAYLEHYGVLERGARFRLMFRWQGDDIEFLCEVARSKVVRSPGGDGRSMVSHTGVRFVEAVGESEARLQNMMATFVGRLLSAQKANASGDATPSDDHFLGQLGEARRARSRGFLTYRWIAGAWERSSTEDPAQPSDGFTVASYEDEEELETLCRAYEQADDEGRRLIRLVAELSTLSARRA